MVMVIMMKIMIRLDSKIAKCSLVKIMVFGMVIVIMIILVIVTLSCNKDDHGNDNHKRYVNGKISLQCIIILTTFFLLNNFVCISNIRNMIQSSLSLTFPTLPTEGAVFETTLGAPPFIKAHNFETDIIPLKKTKLTSFLLLLIINLTRAPWNNCPPLINTGF